jgi:malate dehydrogenase (oxaloacetate-decarboxylating)(NADP+)
MPGTDKSDRSISQVTDQEALDFHARGRPGKLEINPTKPMATQRDLSLAYSPGVAVPVKAIAEDPSRAFDYTPRATWWPSSPTAPPSSASAISARWPPSR